MKNGLGKSTRESGIRKTGSTYSNLYRKETTTRLPRVVFIIQCRDSSNFSHGHHMPPIFTDCIENWGQSSLSEEV